MKLSFIEANGPRRSCKDMCAIAVLIVLEFQDPATLWTGQSRSGERSNDLQARCFRRNLNTQHTGGNPLGAGRARTRENVLAAKLEQGTIPGQHLQVFRTL